jgi:hypothetical protein
LISKRRAIPKNPIKYGFLYFERVRPPRQLMPLRQIFPPIDVPRTLRNALASALRTTLRIAKRAQYLSSRRRNGSAETFSERTNQDDVSSSLIGAVLAISVGNMLSYIARAS